MVARTSLLTNPPYPVERALKALGANLRTARLRRNLSLQQVAEKIGIDRQVVSAAEKGKPSASAAVYAAMLWAFGLDAQLGEIAGPERDKEGEALARAREGGRPRRPKGLSDDF